MSSVAAPSSVPTKEPLLAALQTATERLVSYATRGSGTQVEPPLTEALSEVEALCSALEGLLAHGFKTRQFLLFKVHPWAFVEHSEKFGELNAEAVRWLQLLAPACPSTSPPATMPPAPAHSEPGGARACGGLIRRGTAASMVLSTAQPALLADPTRVAACSARSLPSATTAPHRPARSH